SASGGADTAVIAGMGGTLICKILSDNIKIAHSIKTLVLQPMTCNFELRKFLHKNGFKIVSEKLAKEENKIYNIMVVTSGEQHFDDEFYYYIGKALFDLKDSLLPEYLKHRANVIKRQIGGMKKSKNPEIIKKSKKLQKLYVRFNKEIAYYDKSK
ncbi:MAG: tRNA (adenine(22)-N(1))-methyltransferase TrmK, partial [Clostridia bacterium]|nr:tRNA (adenine(22)-N(1))-methyltransferase TrmK [Clostridia bacterium]